MSKGKLTLESMSQATWYNQWTINQFKSYLKGDILEIGCGIGNFTTYLERYGNIYAIDIEKNYINLTKKVAKKSSVGIGDIESGKYFFNQHIFDTIVCINVLEHIKNDHQALKNIYKLLKKGGHLIILVPSHQSLYGPIDKAIYHFRRYDKKRLIKEVSSLGISIIRSTRLNFIGGVGWWFAGKILKEDTIQNDKVKLFNIFGPPFLALENIIEPPFGTSILIIGKRNEAT